MIHQITPIFVEEIPEKIQEGNLYLCMQYNALIHKCACGCGEIISTPLDRKQGWIMQYDGEEVTLSPSIGNGAYKCGSHYFIRGNKVIWLQKMSRIEAELVKEKKTDFRDLLKKIWPFKNKM